MFHFPTFPPTGLYIQPAVTHTTKAMHAGFPHSDILVSTFGNQLNQAYRRVPRRSSAHTTKTSTVRPYQLTQPTPPPNRRQHQQHKPQYEQIQAPHPTTKQNNGH